MHLSYWYIALFLQIQSSNSTTKFTKTCQISIKIAGFEWTFKIMLQNKQNRIPVLNLTHSEWQHDSRPKTGLSKPHPLLHFFTLAKILLGFQDSNLDFLHLFNSFIWYRQKMSLGIVLNMIEYFIYKRW